MRSCEVNGTIGKEVKQELQKMLTCKENEEHNLVVIWKNLQEREANQILNLNSIVSEPNFDFEFNDWAVIKDDLYELKYSLEARSALCEILHSILDEAFYS